MLNQILDLLGTEAASNVIIGLIALVVGVVLKLSAVKKYNLERCILALQSAVQETYETYIKGLKKAAKDGKLSDAEKAEAREMAYSQAKTILAEEGIELARYYGPRISKAIIERIVAKSKTAGKIAKGVLDPARGNP